MLSNGREPQASTACHAPRVVADKILDDLETFLDGRTLEDDVTLLLVDFS